MGTDTEPVRVDLHKFPYLEVYMGIMLPHQSFETAMIKKKFTVKEITQNYYSNIDAFTNEWF